MEDRYDISVDIGDGKDWWYVHGLTTHDKVYELNRQMCDLGKTMNDPMKPLSEETAQEMIGKWEEIGKEWASKKKEIVESIFGIITNEKSNIMEEKKTKKMTKAEAFEYLKGTKVKCYKVGEHYGEELLKKLAECGCTSNIFLQKGILSVWAIFISDVCDLSILDTAHADQYGNYDLCEISADDILSIEILDEKKEETESVNIELEKWIGVIRDKFCCNGWSFVISASNFALISGDLIEEKRIKD